MRFKEKCNLLLVDFISERELEKKNCPHGTRLLDDDDRQKMWIDNLGLLNLYKIVQDQLIATSLIIH